MSGLTRQEMKRDEVQEGLVTAVDWIAIHGRQILIGAGALIGVGVLVVLVMLFLSNRAQRANEALGEALTTHSAVIDPIAPDPGNAKAPVFASMQERDVAAEPLLEKVNERYASTASGSIAGVYLGEIAARRGDVERARELWQRFLDRDPDSALAASVRLNLISLDREQGRNAESIEAMRRALDQGSWSLPADVLLWELGRSLEQEGELDEARLMFQRLIDEHPNSPYAGEARTRVGTVA
jgi:tetratricopeptide (TPR) repeat protein